MEEKQKRNIKILALILISSLWMPWVWIEQYSMTNEQKQEFKDINNKYIYEQKHKYAIDPEDTVISVSEFFLIYTLFPIFSILLIINIFGRYFIK